MVIDRPFYESILRELIEQEVSNEDVTDVYQAYRQHFTPTLNMVRTMRYALSENKISIEDYQSCMGEYVETYNAKFGKDIDSSFVENKLVAEDNESSEDSEDIDEKEAMKELHNKDNIFVCEVISDERYEQGRQEAVCGVYEET